MSKIRSDSLYCTEGSANKEYHLELLAAADGGFIVNFRNGARGSAMKVKTKTDSPVPLSIATSIYDKVLKEKLAKGYTPDVSGAAYTSTADAGRVSGWRPPRLKPVDEVGVEALLNSRSWGGSEKKDGERRAVEIASAGVTGINLKGLYVPTPEDWSRTLGSMPLGTLVDGEHVGDHLHLFDCAQFGERDLRGMSYLERYDVLARAMLTYGQGHSNVSLVPMSTDPAEKRAMLTRITAAHGEGIVLRHVGGLYVPGLTDDSIKFKLYEDSTCIVSHVNAGKRSVGLQMLDADSGLVVVGNLTVPPNQVIPAAGSLVDVRYMHMFEGGSLYQPVFKRPRPDKHVHEATLSQVTRIKLKSAVASDEDEEMTTAAEEPSAAQRRSAKP